MISGVCIDIRTNKQEIHFNKGLLQKDIGLSNFYLHNNKKKTNTLVGTFK